MANVPLAPSNEQVVLDLILKLERAQQGLNERRDRFSIAMDVILEREARIRELEARVEEQAARLDGVCEGCQECCDCGWRGQ